MSVPLSVSPFPADTRKLMSMKSFVWQRLSSFFPGYAPAPAPIRHDQPIWRKVLAIAFARVHAVWRPDAC
jgi:hypothetical protein